MGVGAGGSGQESTDSLEVPDVTIDVDVSEGLDWGSSALVDAGTLVVTVPCVSATDAGWLVTWAVSPSDAAGVQPASNTPAVSIKAIIFVRMVRTSFTAKQLYK